MYQSVWKCRLCGQRFIGLTCYSDEETDNVMLNFTNSSYETLRTMHECYGGSKGVADFQGFEKIRDDLR